ncbi:MAG TPA: response regulator [Acidimicrobiales bacterium]|jgi:DNA-binding response OmpR family regulator
MPSATTDGRPGKILVVEDDPAIARILCLLLQRSGRAVLQAADGRGGMALFDDQQPDLVVLDLALPGVDGWGVLRYIRAASAIPVVVVTSDVRSADRSRAEGADAFVTKPFDNQALVEQVDVLLAK